METIGEYLKRERELRNITLEEIAEATKIHVGTLRAIEKEQKELLPAEVFVRGFIRCYAQYIGLDPNDVLLRYPKQAKEAEYPEGISPLPEIKLWSFLSPYRKRLWISIVIIILVLFLGLTAYFGQKSPASQPKATKDKEVLKEGQTPLPGALGQKQLQNKEKRVLRAVFKDNTWIQTVVDGQTLQEYSFTAGETFTWTMNDKIGLVIGNAGGVDFYFNDRPLKPLGNRGQVISIVLPNPALM